LPIHLRLTLRAFIRYWLPVVIMMSLIAVESTDIFSSAHTGSWLAHLLTKFGIRRDLIPEINHILRKTGHCVGYGALSFLIFRAFRGTFRFLTQGYEGWVSSRVIPTMGGDIFHTLWRSYWVMFALIGTALVATADELHQMTLPSRTGTWSDVLLDTSAGVVTQILIYLIDRAKANRIARQRTA
jgi:VanZ family protein